MANRKLAKPAKSSKGLGPAKLGPAKPSKGLGYYVPLWIAPLATLLLAPLYMHAVVSSLAEFTDRHVFVALMLIVTISGLSILGCILDKPCEFPSSCPWVLLTLQLTLATCAVMLMSTSSAVQDDAFARQVAGFLHHRPPRPSAAAHPAEWQVSSGAHPAEWQVSAPVVVLTTTTSLGRAGGPQAQAAADAASGSSSDLAGWRRAGDGYCEELDTHEEFSALHTLGKSLRQCASDASSDQTSIAFDFSAGDQGCDIRYPAGTLSIDMEGYEWYGWGQGEGNPAASGKTKHDLETACYVRAGVATTRPAAAPQQKAKYSLSTQLHPYYKALIREYSFRPVVTNRGQQVNIIIVHSPFQSRKEEDLFNKYKDELLFIGISSLEDFPLPPPNPFSPKFPKDKYVGMFPGFLNMFREPEKIFPSHVKVLDMSQSDFGLPPQGPVVPKKYDFTFSGSDQDIGDAWESDCVGWSMFCKNWTFAKQALEIMCGELGMTGVLVATKDKQDQKRCRIPSSCEGKIVQTTYLSQDRFFSYVRQSRFLFVPQMHDASPRVATQALAMDVPLLMNRNLIGGWKYLTEKTGEFFNDQYDFRESVQRLLRNIKAGGVYEPRKWVTTHYGDAVAGTRLKNWIEEHFRDYVKLPPGTQQLYPVS